jgi:hypothetical protein
MLDEDDRPSKPFSRLLLQAPYSQLQALLSRYNSTLIDLFEGSAPFATFDIEIYVGGDWFERDGIPTVYFLNGAVVKQSGTGKTLVVGTKGTAGRNRKFEVVRLAGDGSMEGLKTGGVREFALALVEGSDYGAFKPR